MDHGKYHLTDGVHDERQFGSCMEKLLITGGAGFIGANFVLSQLAQGERRIINLDKLTYAGNLHSLETVCDCPQYRFVQVDICDGALVAALLAEEQPGAIVHFAAESHVDRSIDGPAPFVQTNIVGTFTLLEVVREHLKTLPADQAAKFRFLHVSTDEVYGALGPAGLFSESSPYRPNSPYSASKASADHLVRSYHHTFGIPVLITNCSNNYGPYQFPEKLIPLMVLNALEGKPLPIYGDGGHVRDWLYVEDHCKAIQCVLEHGRLGETYNIGGHGETSNLELIISLCALLDRLLPDSPHVPHSALITHVPDRPGHDRRYAIDASKIQRELGWKPRETLDTGLEKTVRWYQQHREWCDKVTSGVYRRERLGLHGAPSASKAFRPPGAGGA